MPKIDDANTTPEYVGDQPDGCRVCGRGYRDGAGGWWCCGNGEQRRSDTTVKLDTGGGELRMLRDVVLRAHQMAGGNYVQSAEEMRRRIYRILDAAIDASPAMKGFLGRGGPEAHRDIIAGSGDLS